MILYHGTTLTSAQCIMRRGVIFSRCQEYTDFGQGFYTSKHEEFSRDTAINRVIKSKARGIEIVPAVVVLNFDETALEQLNCLNFEQNDDKWLQFIVNNRNGYVYTNAIGDDFHNINQTYDIVQGGIADGMITEYANECRMHNSVINKSFVNRYVYNEDRKAHQTSFHTHKAFDYLKAIEIMEVMV